MSATFDALARAALFRLDPETGHRLAINALALGLVPAVAPLDDWRLRTSLFGLSFPNPVGLAAGFDKDGEVAGPLLRSGFGFVEIGTVTPKPQSGNPKPRLFRLVPDRAVINRMGFNNKGHAALVARLKKARPDGILGINIGANKESTDRISDYVDGVAAFAPYASYFALNVSSPNTPGLRELQGRAALEDLLARVVEAREAARKATGRRVPLILKVAPDLTESDIDDITGAALWASIDGMIVSNTTLLRTGLTDAQSKEAGGMSGDPLFRLSTIVLARFRQRLAGRIPLIGSGGISSPETALAKIEAGADLVQIYSALVFEGMSLVPRVVKGLSQAIAERGVAKISDLVGTRAEAWAAETP